MNSIQLIEHVDTITAIIGALSRVTSLANRRVLLYNQEITDN